MKLACRLVLCQPDDAPAHRSRVLKVVVRDEEFARAIGRDANRRVVKVRYLVDDKAWFVHSRGWITLNTSHLPPNECGCEQDDAAD